METSSVGKPTEGGRSMTSAMHESNGQATGELSNSSKAESMQKAGTLGAGGILTLAGLSRGGVVGLAMAAVGSDLLYGGIRGRSLVLQRLGMNNRITSRSAVVPHKQSRLTEHTVTIDRPREELYT